MFCAAAMIAAIVSLSAINYVEDHFHNFENGGKYEDANAYRAGAIWLIVVGSVGIAFHPLMVFVHHSCIIAVMKCSFNKFTYLVSDS